MRRFALFVLIMVACTLVGCADVTVERSLGRDGSLTETIEITFDRDALEGYTVSEACSIAANLLDRRGYTVSTSGATVRATRHYTREELLAQSEESDGPTSETLLFETYETENVNLLKAYLIESSPDVLWSGFSGMDYDDFREVTLTYRYVTPLKNVTSNGAVSESGGRYTHVWRFTEANVDGTVRIIQRIPRTEVWYGISVAIAILIVGVSVVRYIQRRKLMGR